MNTVHSAMRRLKKHGGTPVVVKDDRVYMNRWRSYHARLQSEMELIP